MSSEGGIVGEGRLGCSMNIYSDWMSFVFSNYVVFFLHLKGLTLYSVSCIIILCLLGYMRCFQKAKKKSRNHGTSQQSGPDYEESSVSSNRMKKNVAYEWAETGIHQL